MPQPSLTAEQSALAQQLQDAQQALALAKQRELDLRNKLADALFGINRTEGTHTLDFGGGWKIKATQPYTYALDKEDDFAKVRAVCAQLGDDARRVIPFKPDVKQGEYKKLDPEKKALVNSVLTITPGQVQIAFEMPKGAQ